jgi:hypothetical protein
VSSLVVRFVSLMIERRRALVAAAAAVVQSAALARAHATTFQKHTRARARRHNFKVLLSCDASAIRKRRSAEKAFGRKSLASLEQPSWSDSAVLSLPV